MLVLLPTTHAYAHPYNSVSHSTNSICIAYPNDATASAHPPSKILSSQFRAKVKMTYLLEIFTSALHTFMERLGIGREVTLDTQHHDSITQHREALLCSLHGHRRGRVLYTRTHTHTLTYS
jgi:hypothetical protein